LASFDQNNAFSWLGPDALYRFRRDRLQIRKLHCTVHALDALNLDPVFAKIDVQGYEYAVLAGGRKTLEKHEPILLVEDLHGDPRLCELVGELGYEEYFFDGSSLKRGASPTENTFLLTAKRLRQLA
jgi:hypothetical protein